MQKEKDMGEKSTETEALAPRVDKSDHIKKLSSELKHLRKLYEDTTLKKDMFARSLNFRLEVRSHIY